MVSIGLAACDGPLTVQQELTEAQRATLLERVSEYWRAIESKDYATAYEYTTPNYRRVFPKNMFLNKFGYSLQSELTAVEVTHYDGNAAVASVVVRVMSSSTKPTSEASQVLGAIPISHKEKWLLRDGQWWKSPKIW
jgi:hypothetical protein